MHTPFRWRDLRDFGVGVSFWPLHWWPLFAVTRDDDEFGGAITIELGPLLINFHYNAHDGPLGKPLPDELR